MEENTDAEALSNIRLVVGANAGVTGRGLPLEPDPTAAACGPGNHHGASYMLPYGCAEISQNDELL